MFVLHVYFHFGLHGRSMHRLIKFFGSTLSFPQNEAGGFYKEN